MEGTQWQTKELLTAKLLSSDKGPIPHYPLCCLFHLEANSTGVHMELSLYIIFLSGIVL